MNCSTLETLLSDMEQVLTAASCLRFKHGDAAEDKARQSSRTAQINGDYAEQIFWTDVLETIIADRASPDPVHHVEV